MLSADTNLFSLRCQSRQFAPEARRPVFLGMRWSRDRVRNLRTGARGNLHAAEESFDTTKAIEWPKGRRVL